MWGILYRTGTDWLLQIINLSYISVMKLRNISIISAGIIMLLLPVKASAYIIPKDLPTIEALIALHKAIKKDEDKGLSENGYCTLQKSWNTECQENIGASYPEPFLMCKGTADWRNAK